MQVRIKRIYIGVLLLLILIPGALKAQEVMSKRETLSMKDGKGLEGATTAARVSLLNAVKSITAPEVTFRPGVNHLKVTLVLSEDLEYTEEAPFVFEWSSEDSKVLRITSLAHQEQEAFQGTLDSQLETRLGATKLVLEARLYYCRKIAKTCLFKQVHIEIPIQVAEQGAVTQQISVPIEV